MKVKKTSLFIALTILILSFTIQFGLFKTKESDHKEVAIISEQLETISCETIAPKPTIPEVSKLIIPEDASGEEAIRMYAEYHGINFESYPERLWSVYEENPEAREFVLNYPLEIDKDHKVDMSEFEDVNGVPLFIQWDQRWGYTHYGSSVGGITGCGPTCLSMVAYYYTKDPNMSPDKIMEFAIEHDYYVYGHGTAWTLMSEGSKKLGFDVKEVPLMESKIIKYLESGNPIICSVGPGYFTSFGHFIVLAGYENGMIRVNDPNSYERSECLWLYDDIKDQISNMWVIFD